MIWADLWGVICVCHRGYGGVWVLVGLTVVKMGGVVYVEVYGCGLGIVSAEYTIYSFVEGMGGVVVVKESKCIFIGD